MFVYVRREISSQLPFGKDITVKSNAILYFFSFLIVSCIKSTMLLQVHCVPHARRRFDCRVTQKDVHSSRVQHIAQSMNWNYDLATASVTPYWATCSRCYFTRKVNSEYVEFVKKQSVCFLPPCLSYNKLRLKYFTTRLDQLILVMRKLCRNPASRRSQSFDKKKLLNFL